MRTRAAVTAATFVACGLLTSTACTGGDDSAPSSTVPTGSSAPTASGSAPNPEPKPKPVNPFTGRGPVPKRPTISVKIDDTAPGRPQVGINQADIVFIEAGRGRADPARGDLRHVPAEDGRLRAQHPAQRPAICCCSSARSPPPYSGGAHDALPRCTAPGSVAGATTTARRFYSRRARGAVQLHQRGAEPVPGGGDGQHAGSARHRLDLRPQLTGCPRARARVPAYRRSVRTPVVFRYSRKLDKYVRYIGGVPQRTARRQSGRRPNVIVQKCNVASAKTRRERQPVAVHVTRWATGGGVSSATASGSTAPGRGRRSDGTVWRTEGGKEIPLAPGNSRGWSSHSVSAPDVPAATAGSSVSAGPLFGPVESATCLNTSSARPGSSAAWPRCSRAA